MSNTAPPRRSPSVCALLLACAATLGGCSVLERLKPVSEVDGKHAAAEYHGSDSSFEWGATPALALSTGVADQAGDRAEASGHAADPEDLQGETESEATWSLQTLQSLPGLQASGDVLTLERAWQLAVEHDPDYQAALSGRAAAQTELRLGRAAILPQIQASYSKNKITGLQRNYANGMMREGDLDYDSTSAYIQLQQPVFNLERYASFQGGKARARLGEAEFAVGESEAAIRLATAFLDSVAAQGRAKLAHALAASLEEQATLQDALFERNEASRVDAQETRARLALAQADVIAAEDELRVANRRLQGLIGQEPPPLAQVDNIEPSRLAVDASLAQWLERALAGAGAIRSADARVRVADTEVRRAASRHLPTANLVVAWADADSENLDSLSQRSNTWQFGLQMAIPIFSGGYDTANHARSRHERRQAEHELSQAREQTAAEVTRQYTTLQGTAQRIAALMSSVESGEQSLEAARHGYEYGVNSNLDVLRRQDSLFQARYELLGARVAWLEARVALATVAGVSPASVFIALDSTLSP